MKPWKRLGLFALLGWLLSWVISCSSPPAPSASPEIEFWTMQLQPQFTEYFNKLIATFESENPEITVRWVDVPWSEMERKILTAVSAKTAPDVVNLNPSFASQLATRNAWLDLDNRISPADQQQYLPKIWNASTVDNKSFGIPWYLTTRVTIYNQALLEEAGINQPPATYAELAEVAQQVKDKTGKYAFFVTFVPDDSGEVLESFVQMGVQLVDDSGEAAFNTPEGKAAFQYWVNLYKKGLLPREVLTQGHRNAIELYQAGETALLASGAEFLKTIETNAPDIAKVSATAPQITGETGKKNVAVMNVVIPRDTDKPEEALKFALFVTNTNNQLAFAKAANVLPSTVKAVEAYKTELSKAASGSSVEQARSISATQLTDAEVLVPAMKDLNKLQKAIYENLQAAMLDEKTVEQAVADAAEEWNQR
ncbi:MULTISPECIES: ABC transporter substrate-binding protein [unclassified Coleofasciculus]|uniref:ABC transporter substrate-binding protein n=1 Tax=unclassified Coleofasciculus TaxID=2692782 RepID=UPI00187E86F1|nr:MULTISPECIES: sugar ABC transporter substrate-binding protein [unclassified Coleofasciculus]MBE9129670.1 sugar ABC transporter substrate-binding protein [Coleofasciculus sp. LEGE 07081]MBE9152201.1 sugar ABC transporter substrate-binding protein [Coleofasciculus sp. LEGE 07092]